MTLREHKGVSTLRTESDYTAISLVTTGYDPRLDDIIELGAAKVRNGVVEESYEQLVNPERPIDDFLSDLTGIANESLSDAPVLPQALPKFLDFIQDGFLVGANTSFKVNFLYDNAFDTYGRVVRNNFIDIKRLARKVIPDLDVYNVSSILDHYGEELSPSKWKITSILDIVHAYECLKSDMSDSGLSYGREFDRSGTSSYGMKVRDRKLSDMVAVKAEQSEPNPAISGNEFVFTGALQRMLRRDAQQLVLNVGGSVGKGVTKRTNYLVLGNNDYHQTSANGKSSKQLKAEKLKLSGLDIEIISENVFYDMLSM